MSQEKIFKISIKDGDYTITFSGPRNAITPEYIAMMVRESRKAIDSIQNPVPVFVDTPKEEIEQVIKQPEPTPVKIDLGPKDDCFNIRERLPNNVIDPALLEINSTTKEKALVRCPHCGQAHVAVIVKADQENYLMVYNSGKKEFIFTSKGSLDANEVESLSLRIDKDTDQIDTYNLKYLFYEDLQSLLDNGEEFPKDVVVYENTLIYCPVCKKEGFFTQWKEAYYNPLNYFETENPCIVCGGEMLSFVDKRNSKDKKHTTTKCDSCGHKEVQEVK